MNFRNISAWSIRNPVPPIVLFIGLTLAGLVSFMRMDVNQNPDITFPGAVVASASPALPRARWKRRSPSASRPRSAASRASTKSTATVSEGTSQTFVQFTIGTPIDRAVNDVRDAVVADPRRLCPTESSSRRSSAPTVNGEPVRQFRRVETKDMTPRGAELVRRERRLASRSSPSKACRASSAMAAVDREIRIILDPAKMQAHGITAAQVNQQLRATNTNAAGGRAEIAGSRTVGPGARQCARAPTTFARPRSRSAAANGQARRHRGGQGPLLRAPLARQDERPSGRQLRRRACQGRIRSHLLRRGAEELDKIEKDNPQGPLRRSSSPRSNIPRTSTRRRCRAMIEGAVLAVLVVFLFLRDSARPSFPRWRSRCRRSRPSGS